MRNSSVILPATHCVPKQGTYPSFITKGIGHALLIALFAVPGTQAATNGPLRVHPTNKRYFADASGKIVLLTGSHTWNNFLDIGTTSPPHGISFSAYLTFLQNRNHNFIRGRRKELPVTGWNNGTASPWYDAPNAYARSTTCCATDGGNRFDLNQFNQPYFDRLRSDIQMAQAQGIYYSVMLFDGNVQSSRLSNDGYPYTGANNINGVDDGYTSGSSGIHSEDLSVPAITALQDAYVKKLVDTVNDLDNVLYEICNECGGSFSLAWQAHFIELVHVYEKGGTCTTCAGTPTFPGKPLQHPVGFTFPYPYSGGDSILYTSSADWVSPSTMVSPSNGTKVILNDSDHSFGPGPIVAASDQTRRNWIWENFTQGASLLFMDPYLIQWTGRNNCTNPVGGVCSGTDPTWDSIRNNLGYTVIYANKMNLAAMTPQPGMSSTGYCLANAVATGAEYLAYAPSGGSFTVNLAATSATLNVEWFNPATGAPTSVGTVAGGSTKSFTPPFGGDAVLYLKDAVSVPAPSPCDVNSDGATNVVDVQKEVNMALGIAPCTNASGSCTVLSVQRVVNAVLGMPCVAP